MNAHEPLQYAQMNLSIMKIADIFWAMKNERFLVWLLFWVLLSSLFIWRTDWFAFKQQRAYTVSPMYNWTSCLCVCVCAHVNSVIQVEQKYDHNIASKYLTKWMGLNICLPSKNLLWSYRYLQDKKLCQLHAYRLYTTPSELFSMVLFVFLLLFVCCCSCCCSSNWEWSDFENDETRRSTVRAIEQTARWQQPTTVNKATTTIKKSPTHTKIHRWKTQRERIFFWFLEPIVCDILSIEKRFDFRVYFWLRNFSLSLQVLSRWCDILTAQIIWQVQEIRTLFVTSKFGNFFSRLIIRYGDLICL